MTYLYAKAHDCYHEEQKGDERDSQAVARVQRSICCCINNAKIRKLFPMIGVRTISYKFIKIEMYSNEKMTNVQLILRLDPSCTEQDLKSHLCTKFVRN